MVERDNLHFSFREVDGYNKPFNFIVSEREAGKSTAGFLDKAYKAFLEGYTTLVIRRQINDITEVYIEDIAKVINKFIENPISFSYKKGGIKEGIIDIKVEDKLFIRIVALSNPVSRIKSLMLPNLRYIIFDEFICNTKFGEKYLKNEAIKFFECYNTFQRESKKLTCYFLGNPYSLYNPYFVELGVNTKALRRGKIQAGVNWAVQLYEIKQELRDFIKARNPLYQFDNSYTRYAFGGEAINDENIKLGTKPENYSLEWVFRSEGKYIGIYRNNYYEDKEDRYYCEFITEFSKRRTALCFDLNELVDRTALVSVNEKVKLSRFKTAMRNRLVLFNSIELYYLIEDIFYLI